MTDVKRIIREYMTSIGEPSGDWVEMMARAICGLAKTGGAGMQAGKTIHRQDVMGGDVFEVAIGPGEIYASTCDILQDAVFEHLGDAGTVAVMLPDPLGEACHLAQDGLTFSLSPSLSSETFLPFLMALLGHTCVRYGRLVGCPNLTFFFVDTAFREPHHLDAQIPGLFGTVVAVHRDLDHLTLGVDPYSDD